MTRPNTPVLLSRASKGGRGGGKVNVNYYLLANHHLQCILLAFLCTAVRSAHVRGVVVLLVLCHVVGWLRSLELRALMLFESLR